jgi:hypothetical protein
MEFRRSYPLPVRLYRGSTYVLSSIKPPEKYDPVLYDHEGYPVRWVPNPPPLKHPIGFRMRRDES